MIENPVSNIDLESSACLRSVDFSESRYEILVWNEMLCNLWKSTCESASMWRLYDVQHGLKLVGAKRKLW